MADAPVVHIGENSPEKVALDITKLILSSEEHPKWTRRLLLDTYAEALHAVKGYREFET